MSFAFTIFGSDKFVNYASHSLTINVTPNKQPMKLKD